MQNSNVTTNTHEKGWSIGGEVSLEGGVAAPGPVGGPNGKGGAKVTGGYADKHIDQTQRTVGTTGTGTTNFAATEGVVRGRLVLVLQSGPWYLRIPLGVGVDVRHQF